MLECMCCTSMKRCLQWNEYTDYTHESQYNTTQTLRMYLLIRKVSNPKISEDKHKVAVDEEGPVPVCHIVRTRPSFFKQTVRLRAFLNSIFQLWRIESNREKQNEKIFHAWLVRRCIHYPIRFLPRFSYLLLVPPLSSENPS